MSTLATFVAVLARDGVAAAARLRQAAGDAVEHLALTAPPEPLVLLLRGVALGAALALIGCLLAVARAWAARRREPAPRQRLAAALRAWADAAPSADQADALWPTLDAARRLLPPPPALLARLERLRYGDPAPLDGRRTPAAPASAAEAAELAELTRRYAAALEDAA